MSHASSLFIKFYFCVFKAPLHEFLCENANFRVRMQIRCPTSGLLVVQKLSWLAHWAQQANLGNEK